MAASYFSTFDRSSELALWPFKSRVISVVNNRIYLPPVGLGQADLPA
jgi:hypothetical protein